MHAVTGAAMNNSAIDPSVQGEVDTAIDKVRVQYQPKIDALNDCLSKYKQQTDELMQKKESLEKRLNENMILNPGDEANQIRRRRNQIAEVHEEIKQEKERQTVLKAQLRAYNLIQQKLGENGNSQEHLLQLLEQYQKEKAQLQKEIDSSLSIKLQEKMYEIDFDTY